MTLVITNPDGSKCYPFGKPKTEVELLQEQINELQEVIVQLTDKK